MPRVSACHAEDSDVYHNNSACTERNNIEYRNRKSGTGGKRLCNHCARLNAAGE